MTNEQIKAYEEQLKPCPFCGGKAKLYNRFGWWYVACRSLRDICKVDCSTIQFDSPEKAIEVWNKRGGGGMKAKLISVTEPEGKPIWFRTYEFECIDCGKHFTRHRFDSRTNPYCADCNRKRENERQKERIETKKQRAINDVLDKIRAEIDEQYDIVRPYNIDVAEGLEMALEIIEKYKGVSE